VLARDRLRASHASITTPTPASTTTEDRIGTLAEGKDADIILVSSDPLADIAVLADAANIPLVVKSGIVAKDALQAWSRTRPPVEERRSSWRPTP
jgi:predicted amidohydrolase